MGYSTSHSKGLTTADCANTTAKGKKHRSVSQPFKEQGLIGPCKFTKLVEKIQFTAGIRYLIIISEHRDIIPTVRKPEFMNFGTPAKPFTAPESISPAQKQLRKKSSKDIHKDPDTIYQIFQQDDYPQF